MKVLKLKPGLSARERGQHHGEEFRQDIQELAAIRTELIQKNWDRPASAVRDKARLHLPILESYDQDLYEEFQGIAQASGCGEVDLLILNHYTDLRDLSLVGEGMEEGCSILHVRYGEEVLVGQTWDMHATSAPYVMMLYLPDEEVWAQTITGCLALCGMNRKGLAVAINNLVMSDAKVGISWPTLVRRMLREPNVAGAERVLLGAPVGSGHHYALADPSTSRAWETSGSHQALVYDGSRSPYIHTNHCLDRRMEELSRIAETSTTLDRFLQAEELLKENPTPTGEQLWDMMGCRKNFPNSLFTDRSTPDNPHGVATCARVLMDCARQEIWARSALDSDQTMRKFEWS